MPADTSPFAGATHEVFGAPVPTNGLEYNEGYIVAARKWMGDDAFAAAWEVGASKSIDEAIDYALEDETLDCSRLPAETHDD